MSGRKWKRQAPGAVAWHLPIGQDSNGRWSYAKRPIGWTTTATSDLIGLLAGDGLTWAQLVSAIHYDDKAKTIALAFVEAGFGDVQVREHTDLELAWSRQRSPTDAAPALA